jgi:hypothetical protein
MEINMTPEVGQIWTYHNDNVMRDESYTHMRLITEESDTSFKALNISIQTEVRHNCLGPYISWEVYYDSVRKSIFGNKFKYNDLDFLVKFGAPRDLMLKYIDKEQEVLEARRKELNSSIESINEMRGECTKLVGRA